MILGYPGTTERYLTSYGIDFYVKESYPTQDRDQGKETGNHAHRYGCQR